MIKSHACLVVGFVCKAYSLENRGVVRANLNKDPDDVSKMFDDVASRYDFLNDLLSLGRTKAWRKSVTAIISPKSGMKILDIAAGTGSSSRPLVDKGAEVIALDFSEGMLAQGRKIVVAEFSHPTNKLFKFIYLNYLMKALPVIARKISKNPQAYIYLAESIRAWPDQAGLALVLEKNGWKSVAWQDLTFGIVAVHIGYKA